ncbi:MAG: hypothetical protein JW807_00340 [Spirochaetes bacterium]|nr:hypothetical protein [Spirochaetota bacterium]
MEPKTTAPVSHMDYQKFWSVNLQQIEQMQQHVEKSLHELETSYVDFEQFYAGVMQQLQILSSVYSGYNTLGGGEHVLRLKSLLESYRKRYTREGINFNLINRLLIKISNDRNVSFENFPALPHENKPLAVEEDYSRSSNCLQKKCKWITFERNRSWFIARYHNAEIIKNINIEIRLLEESEFADVDTGTQALPVKDIFGISPQYNAKPRFFILLDDASMNYAADRLGKRIYADHDFITPMVTPFRHVTYSSLSPGRVRLFGRSHLFLY